MTHQSHSTPPAESGRGGLRPDIVAGLTAAAVVLPKATAYATVAGLPVAVGLYTAFVPMPIPDGKAEVSAPRPTSVAGAKSMSAYVNIVERKKNSSRRSGLPGKREIGAREHRAGREAGGPSR